MTQETLEKGYVLFTEKQELTSIVEKMVEGIGRISIQLDGDTRVATIHCNLPYHVTLQSLMVESAKQRIIEIDKEFSEL